MSSHYYPNSAHRNNTSNEFLNKSMKKSNSKKHYHQQSMDDFIKHIKKYNLRSQRYISSKPLLYMYARNNTTNTIDKQRSRSLSNRKSLASKSKKLKKRIQKIFESEQSPIKHKKTKSDQKMNRAQHSQNPAEIIGEYSHKLAKAQKQLQKKSLTGVYLCQQFHQFLNVIVQSLVNKLDEQFEQVRIQASKEFATKYSKHVRFLQRQNQKLFKKFKQIQKKLENSTSLIYQIRKINLIDVDYLYGKQIMGTSQCGGIGYGNTNHQQSNKTYSDHQSQCQIGHGKPFQMLQKKQFQQIDIYEQKESGRIRQISGWEKKPGKIINEEYYQENHEYIMRKFSN